MTPPPVVVLGASAGPRVDAFRAGLARFGAPPAAFVSYDAFVADPAALRRAITPGAVLRFDSPDRDRASLAALYRLGAAPAAEAGYTAFTGDTAARLMDDHGAIGSPAQLAFGLERALTDAAAIATEAGARLLSTPTGIAQTFDKTACAAHLEAHGIAVPRQIGPVSGFDDLMDRMRTAKLSRVFVKLRFGSSAAGMTALALGPGGQIAAYTTGVLGADGSVRATRAVRRLAHHREVRGIIDALAPLGLHAEAWLPKTSVDDQRADLRIILVDGKPVFTIMRLSDHPMTNLHLGGTRRPPGALRDRVGKTVWGALLESCRAVGRAYPSCFMLGVDAAILTGDRRHAVFEVNAFGDHVKGAQFRGCSPQEWQILQYGMWREREANAA